jgi:hypothetical protein
VGIRISALRFLYKRTLKRMFSLLFKRSPQNSGGRRVNRMSKLEDGALYRSDARRASKYRMVSPLLQMAALRAPHTR